MTTRSDTELPDAGMDIIEQIDDEWDERLLPPAAPSPAPPAPSPAPAPETSPFAAFTLDREREQTLVARRSDSGRWLDAHLFVILAVAVSLPALSMPAAWVAVCAAGALVMLVADSVRGQARRKGSADVVVVPGRVVGRLLAGFVNPLNWLKVLLGVLASVAVGALLAALVAAARWIVGDGTDGILAAIRMGAWAHAFRYAAVFGCFLLVRGGGGTHERRVAWLRRHTRRAPEFVVAAVAVAVVVAGVSLTLARPGVDIAFVHDADGLGWVPPGLRSLADRARDEVVDEELRSVTHCLDAGQARLWSASYTDRNPLDAPDVARLTADPARAPSQPVIAAAALAAQNHLAPWVETLVIAVGDQVALTVDRHGIDTAVPLVDPGALRSHTAGEPEWLTTVGTTMDRSTVLTCSARTPF